MNDSFETLVQQADLHSPAPETEPARQAFDLARARELVRARGLAAGRPLTARVETFGCQMNARDSEKIIGILRSAGFTDASSEDADFLVYNTCTVRDNADQRVFGRLGRAGHLKRNRPGMKIAVCGCMVQEQTNVEKIRKSYRFVDLIFGTHNLYRFPEYLCACLESEGMVIEIWDRADRIVEALPVARKYPFKSGVNISFGCNNFCSYCIVPYVRGRERSRAPRDILHECAQLAADGVVEIMLLGQNVNSYGRDLDTPCSFAELLEQVCRVEGLRRIRFMTPHPKDLSDDLIRVIAENEIIARHVHLPLQSGSDRILRRMNRRYTKEQYISLAEKIRARIPDVSITTDIIVGFPGETDADIDDTIDVVRRVGFDNAFTFIYSKRAGTPAAKMEDQVPEAEKNRLFNRVLTAVQETAHTRAGRLTGRVMEALAEEVNLKDSSLITCRLSNNMLVHVPGDPSMIGKMLPVRLDECRGFYFFGSVILDS
ncbi:MAG: tRNA (N6-isopentenyl adenosine(37)-C2)-methylthiotransferase MiaB [Eubacteriales bacterium]|nr:tRNA (N6-isopentenyl adenosine(37)-C2)-methylthiotransferase MiaB [Eubacteriales bacterium]